VDNGWGGFWLHTLGYVEPASASGSLSLSDVLPNGQTVGEALNQLQDIKNTTTAVLGLSV